MKKKITYALGEIVIVIIGITIAFSLNKCSENEKNTKQRNNYIVNLTQDINDDKTQLEKNLETIKSKIETTKKIISAFRTKDNGFKNATRDIFAIAQLTNFTPKDYTYQTLVNSGDLKLFNDINIKTEIEKHYSEYKDLAKAYERQEIIHKEYLGKYFIYNTDYDLMSNGDSPFKDKQLLKNIVQSMLGSLMIKQTATEQGIQSCENTLDLLESHKKA